MTKQSETEFNLSIDQNRLDDEWLAQPKLYFQYAAELADARRDLDFAKNSLEVVKAELYQSIMSSPDAYGLAKTTENAINSALPTQDGYQDAQAVVVKAKHRVAVLDAVVGALDHRKKALEHLVSLFLSNYYSKPKASDGTKDRMDEVERDDVRRRGRRKRADR